MQPGISIRSKKLTKLDDARITFCSTVGDQSRTRFASIPRRLNAPHRRTINCSCIDLSLLFYRGNTLAAARGFLRNSNLHLSRRGKSIRGWLQHFPGQALLRAPGVKSIFNVPAGFHLYRRYHLYDSYNCIYD